MEKSQDGKEKKVDCVDYIFIFVLVGLLRKVVPPQQFDARTTLSASLLMWMVAM